MNFRHFMEADSFDSNFIGWADLIGATSKLQFGGKMNGHTRLLVFCDYLDDHGHNDLAALMRCTLNNDFPTPKADSPGECLDREAFMATLKKISSFNFAPFRRNDRGHLVLGNGANAVVYADGRMRRDSEGYRRKIPAGFYTTNYEPMQASQLNQEQRDLIVRAVVKRFVWFYLQHVVPGATSRPNIGPRGGRARAPINTIGPVEFGPGTGT